MIEAVEYLEIDAETVVFGHTHRRGPRGRGGRWKTKSGTKVVNTGSWVYSPGLLGATSADSPYWPGPSRSSRDGEVEFRFLLDDVPHARSATGSKTRQKLSDDPSG